MPPRTASIKNGRRVTIAEPIKPVLKSALTKNTKGRVSEPEKRSTRLILDEDDEDEDGIDEDVDESQETNSSLDLRKLAAAELKKRKARASKKPSTLQAKLQGLFDEARQESAERKEACNTYLETILKGVEAFQERDIAPDHEINDLIKLIGSRNAFGKRVAGNQGSEPYVAVSEDLEQNLHEAREKVATNGQLRERSRKRLMKYVQHDFKRSLETQKFATDANEYIRHYKKLIML